MGKIKIGIKLVEIL